MSSARFYSSHFLESLRDDFDIAAHTVADRLGCKVTDLEFRYLTSEQELQIAIQMKQSPAAQVAEFVYFDLPLIRKDPPTRSVLYALVRVADVLPIATRKAIKALAGDYMHEVQRLYSEGRPGMAKWNVCLAWCCAAWYVLRSPVDWVLAYVLKSMRGSSQ
jgi:hypothetical protein